MPLHVIASTEDGGAQEEIETDLDAVSRASYGTDGRTVWGPNDLQPPRPVSKWDFKKMKNTTQWCFNVFIFILDVIIDDVYQSIPAGTAI